MEKDKVIGIIVFIFLIGLLSIYAEFKTNKTIIEKYHKNYNGILIKVTDQNRGYFGLYLDSDQYLSTDAVKVFYRDLQVGDSISKPSNSDSIYHLRYEKKLDKCVIRNKSKLN